MWSDALMHRQPDPRFVIEPFEAAYRSLTGDELERRADTAYLALQDCHFCPRECAKDRLEDELGFCRTGREARVTSAFAHPGEEDVLRGSRGSGTIFFGGCGLGCVFCQNHEISSRSAGEPVSAERLASIMLDLQAAGCHNINLVTPSHVVPQILAGVAVAARKGLELPLVYNSGGYDTVATLRFLDGIVDIYMPDFKFWAPETARRLAGAADYPDRARDALREMHRQVGVLKLSPDGLARRGLLVRHLVMPGLVAETSAILHWISHELSPDTYVNVMAQYRPDHRVGQADRQGQAFDEIDRPPTRQEVREAVLAAQDAGLQRLDGRRL
jgi:putative pyruvate formate lyase activating enzyme